MRHERKALRREQKPEADHSVLRVLPPSSVPSSDVIKQFIFPPGNALNASPCGNTFSLPNPSRREFVIYIRRGEIQRRGRGNESSFPAPSFFSSFTSFLFLYISLSSCFSPPCLLPFLPLLPLFFPLPCVLFLQEGTGNSSPAEEEEGKRRERREARETV